MASTWNNGIIASAAMIAAQLLVGCGGSGNAGTTHATVSCVPGQAVACACPDGRNSSMTCSAVSGAYDPCVCPAVGGPVIAGGAGGSTTTVGAAGVKATGSGGVPVPTAGVGGVGGRGGPNGLAGVGGRAAGGAGASSGRGGAGGTGGAAGSIGAGGAGSNDLDTVRQVCVDTINMYRATIPGLAPLARGSAAQEMCSDTGAKKDGDSGVAHGSAGDCKSLGLPGEQDTCPGWAVGGPGGSATLADALKKCLMQMWGEGMPPVSRQACQMDYQNCFLKYGHYLNMSDPNPKVVACGFYKMMNGSWWMNQNFGN